MKLSNEMNSIMLEISNIIDNQLKQPYLNKEDYIKKSVSKNPFELFYLDEEEQTEDVCVEAVKRNSHLLACVFHQTPKICLAAIDNDPLSIEFVEDQTEDLCLHAIHKNIEAFKYINNPTEEMCREAVGIDPHMIKFINHPSKYVRMEAITLNPMTLEYIDNPTIDECLLAAKNSKFIIKIIKNQDPELFIKIARLMEK